MNITETQWCCLIFAACSNDSALGTARSRKSTVAVLERLGLVRTFDSKPSGPYEPDRFHITDKGLELLATQKLCHYGLEVVFMVDEILSLFHEPLATDRHLPEREPLLTSCARGYAVRMYRIADKYHALGCPPSSFVDTLTRLEAIARESGNG